MTLARGLKERAGLADRIRAALKAAPERDAEGELEILRRFAGELSAKDADGGAAEPRKPARAGQGGRTKTTFHIGSTAGQVKCTAAQGRPEIKADRDFSAIDRARLERAIADLMDGLG